MLIRTVFLSVPIAITLTLASPNLLEINSRICSGSTGFSNCTLKLRPPVKSILWLKPRMANEPIQTRMMATVMIRDFLFVPIKSKRVLVIKFLETGVVNVRFNSLSLFMKCS